MKKILVILTVTFCLYSGALAQFPKLPKFEKPKLPNLTGANSGQTTAVGNTAGTTQDNATPKLPPTTIIKPTMMVRAALDRGYWKIPDAPNYWSWMPQVKFMMTGPVEDASFIAFEFFTPDGKPWYSWDTKPFAISSSGTHHIESEAVRSWRDTRSMVLTGKFTFKVTLKNNLNGTSKEIYKGSFIAGKKFAGTAHKDFKNQYAFYVDHDWALPIGYVGMDGRNDAQSPRLNSNMWFRGDLGSDKMAAYLYYNGKQISSTKTGGSADGIQRIIHEGDDSGESNWELWNFSFFNVRSADPASSYPNSFLLKNNPGNYEIKVLYDGELVRAASFSVGANGTVTDNGISTNNGFGAMGTVVPVKITPTVEKIGNLQAWKTEAFYGNPLTGFTAQ